MSDPEQIKRAVASVTTAFTTEGTAAAVLASATTSVHRLLSEGEEMQLDVPALVAAIVEAGLDRQLINVLQDSSRVEASPELLAELHAAAVLTLSEIFARSSAAARAAGNSMVAMVAEALEEAQASAARTAAARAAAAITGDVHNPPVRARTRAGTPTFPSLNASTSRAGRRGRSEGRQALGPPPRAPRGRPSRPSPPPRRPSL